MEEEPLEMIKVVIDNDRLCDVCKYSSAGCGGGVHGGPNGPIYPPCADSDPQSYVDEDRLENVYNEIVEEAEK